MNATQNTTARAIFEELADFFPYLYGRWQDEKEYEDFADYREAVEKRLPPDCRLVKMTQRPFAFQFQIGAGGPVYEIRANSREYALRPVPAAWRSNNASNLHSIKA